MRFSAIVLLLSCWPLQPIHASLPEPAPPLKLILRDASCSVVHIAHGSYGTSLLLQNRSDGSEEMVGCILRIIRKGGTIDYDLPVVAKAERSGHPTYIPQPYWKQIICLGEKGTCLVAGRRLCDFRFVPEKNAVADFPDLVPLVGQAWKIGKNNYLLSFAWVNQAKDRLLLLARRPGSASAKVEEELLYYLAKGKEPCAFSFSDEPLRAFQGAGYLSSRSLFLQDGSCVFLCKDGRRLVVFPAAQDNDPAESPPFTRELPGQCKGMSWQGGQDIRLLMQKKNTRPVAYDLNVGKPKASLKEGKRIAALPAAVLLATPFGKRYWVYLTDKKELILWSEKEGPAPAPLVAAGMGFQKADGRILYCLEVNKAERVIGAIDTPPDILYQEAGELKKAAACFPVRGPGGTAGFYIAETQTKGTFYPCLSDGSLFSLKEGYATSLPLPFPPAEIKQAACWLCPRKKGCPRYLALAIKKDKACAIYRLKGDASAPAFDRIKWSREPAYYFECPFLGVSLMQWVVDEESEEPVLVHLSRGATSYLQTVSGFPGPCKCREEEALGRFSYLGEGNLVARTVENMVYIHRVCAKGGRLTTQELFNCSRGFSLYPHISALLPIREQGTAGMLIGFRFPFAGAKTEVQTCMQDTGQVFNQRGCLLPPDFDAYYIGGTNARPCVIVKDREGDLSLLHFVSPHVLVTGYLRGLEVSEEYLYQDVMYLMANFLGKTLLAFQEQTPWRRALITGSSHFAPLALATWKADGEVAGTGVKCLSGSLVPSQQ